MPRARPGRSRSATGRPGRTACRSPPTTSCTRSRPCKSPDASGAMAAAWADVTATADRREDRRVQGRDAHRGLPRGRDPAAAAGPPPVRRPVRGPRHEPVRAGARRHRDLPRSPSSTTRWPCSRRRRSMTASRQTRRRPRRRRRWTRWSRAVPTAPPLPWPTRRSSAVEVHFYPDDATAADAFATGAIDGGRRPAAGRVRCARDGVRCRPPALPDDDARDRAAQPASHAPGAARRRASARRCSGPSTATRSSPTRWAGTAWPPARSSRPRPGRTTPASRRCPFDTKAAAKALTNAGWKKKNGVWTAKGAKAPYKIELLTVPADANPRLAAVADFVAKAWKDFGIGVDVVETPGRRPRDQAPRRRLHRIGRSTSRPASSRTSTRCSRRARCAAPGRTSAATRTRRWTRSSRPRASPASPTARMAAWKALLTGLAARQPLLPLAWHAESVLMRGVDGPHAEAHRRPRGPVLGCASMAPRRGPVSLRAAVRWPVGPRWRNGRRARFRT